MPSPVRIRSARTLGLAALLLAATAGGAAFAQDEERQIETEAEFDSFNPADNTITVKVRKTGRRPANKELAIRQGRWAVFYVEPEGSVLKRTTVKLVDGTAGTFADLEKGRHVRVFWVTDGAKRRARSVAVYKTIQEVSEDVEEP